MPKLVGNYFNFIGGLNTESSVLNADPTSVTSIINCTINRDGSLEQRAGFDTINNIPDLLVEDTVGYEWRYNNIYTQVFRDSKSISFYSGVYPNIDFKYKHSSTNIPPTFTFNNAECLFFTQENGYWEYNQNDNGATFIECFQRDPDSNSDVIPIQSPLVTGRVVQNRLIAVSPRGYIYYSQVGEFSKFYQEADPNSPDDNALVASDGGVLYNTGIGQPYIVEELNGAIIVFADNGIWELFGADGVYVAGEISIKQISEEGIYNNKAVVKLDNDLVYFNTRGVYDLAIGDSITNTIKTLNISDIKIKSLWNVIPITVINRSKIIFDEENKRILIQIPMENNNTKLLIYDILLKAWYYYYFEFTLNCIYPATVVLDDEELIYTNSDEEVISNDDEKIATSVNIQESNNNSKRLILITTDTVGIFNEFNITDRVGDDIYLIEASFSSAHQTFKDYMRKKTPNYLKVLFERSESDIENNYGKDITPGGCLLRTSLNFADDPVMTTDMFGEPFISNIDYGRYRQIYPKVRKHVSIVGNTSKGHSHVGVKEKVLGRGDVLQFNFKSYIDIRYWEALVDDPGHPYINPSNWQEIKEEDNILEYNDDVVYSIGDKVKVTEAHRFKIIGWACEIVASNFSSGAV